MLHSVRRPSAVLVGARTRTREHSPSDHVAGLSSRVRDRLGLRDVAHLQPRAKRLRKTVFLVETVAASASDVLRRNRSERFLGPRIQRNTQTESLLSSCPLGPLECPSNLSRWRLLPSEHFQFANICSSPFTAPGRHVTSNLKNKYLHNNKNCNR